MKIQDSIKKISTLFADLHHKSSTLNQQKNTVMQEMQAAIAKEQQRWSEASHSLDEQEADVMKFYRIAKDNSPKELVVSNSVSPLRPDLSRLNTLVYSINSNNRNDWNASQAIDLCSSYVAYIRREKEGIRQQESTATARIKSQYNNTLNQIEQSRKSIVDSCSVYLKGEEVSALVELFSKIRRNYEVSPSYYEEAEHDNTQRQMMLLGFHKVFVDVPKSLSATMKCMFGHYFDEQNKLIDSPIGFSTKQHKTIKVEYTGTNQNDVYRGIQALIINFLRYRRASGFRVTLIDSIHYNANVIGELLPLCKINNPLIDVPTDEVSTKKKLSTLVAYYQSVENKIGTKSVYEYNEANPAAFIPLRILIINQPENNFGQTRSSQITYLINNANRLGIFVIELVKSNTNGSKGTNNEKRYIPNDMNTIQIISDAQGNQYCYEENDWCSFRWILPSCNMPQAFLNRAAAELEIKTIGTKYFDRYQMTVPKRSQQKRRPVQVPFGVDENDAPILYCFEDNHYGDMMFAAYISGAAGSGKSTLLHTFISGLITNYHPDEVELWLLDFKMTEFRRYVKNTPPHVRYLLLEASEDLVYDIVSRIEGELQKRQKLFADNGWSKISDVPISIYMPQIYIIIDEFAQMAQILKETKGSGLSTDYAQKLENILRKGRALGFRFIFSDQVFALGGLTDAAAKQIQGRLAMKNAPDEMKTSLSPVPSSMADRVNDWISTMPKYQTLFKWQDESDVVHIDLYRNLYMSSTEIDTMILRINHGIASVNSETTNDNQYSNKHPVMIDGSGKPDTFAGMKAHYKRFEQLMQAGKLPEDCQLKDDELFDGDLLVYPGIPRSFDKVKPFILKRDNLQNILLVGKQREGIISVALSIINSYQRNARRAEIWTHKRVALYAKFAGAFAGLTVIDNLPAICDRVAELIDSVKSQTVTENLVVVFGGTNIWNALEMESESSNNQTIPEPVVTTAPDISTVAARLKQVDDPAEKKRIMEEYNRQVAEFNNKQSQGKQVPQSYDAREDIKMLLKKGAEYGIHFVFCFEQAYEFDQLGISTKLFAHKILFSMPKDDSLNLMGNRKASELADNVCLYTDGDTQHQQTLCPHIYSGIPLNGWIVDASGTVVQKG